MVDTQMKRELFYLAGAMQPLCKLLTDGKAAAQLDVAIRSLQNMMKVAMWDDLSVALTALGKPLVQLVERGGLAKRMMAMDLLVKIALFAPTHDALVASGLIEVICLQPKGVIPAGALERSLCCCLLSCSPVLLLSCSPPISLVPSLVVLLSLLLLPSCCFTCFFPLIVLSAISMIVIYIGSPCLPVLLLPPPSSLLPPPSSSLV